MLFMCRFEPGVLPVRNPYLAHALEVSIASHSVPSLSTNFKTLSLRKALLEKLIGIPHCVRNDNAKRSRALRGFVVKYFAKPMP
jgi:hypothetical protein